MRAAAAAIGLLLALEPSGACAADESNALPGSLDPILLEEAEAAGERSQARLEARRTSQERERLAREAQRDACISIKPVSEPLDAGPHERFRPDVKPRAVTADDEHGVG